MFRYFPLVLSLGSIVANAQSAAGEQQMETVGPWGIWIFALLFFGMCAVFVIMTIRNGKKEALKNAKPQAAPIVGTKSNVIE